MPGRSWIWCSEQADCFATLICLVWLIQLQCCWIQVLKNIRANVPAKRVLLSQISSNRNFSFANIIYNNICYESKNHSSIFGAWALSNELFECLSVCLSGCGGKHSSIGNSIHSVHIFISFFHSWIPPRGELICWIEYLKFLPQRCTRNCTVFLVDLIIFGTWKTKQWINKAIYK